MKKILFSAINGHGMGHLVRTVTVAKELRGLAPDLDITFITSSENSNLLYQEGFVSLKVPSWQALNQARNCAQLRASVQIGARAFINELSPDLIVSDSYPYGAYDELKPFIETASMQKVLILNAFPDRLRQPDYVAGVRKYDLILSPFDPSDRAESQLLAPLGAKLIGTIVYESSRPLGTRNTIRRSLSLPFDSVVCLVLLGGGGHPDAVNLMDEVLRVSEAFGSIIFFLLVPPLGRFPIPDHVPSNIRFYHYVPASDLLTAFDLAISASGFNSGAELSRAGIPTVWVPYGQPSTDQVNNAHRFSRKYGGIPVQTATASNINEAFATLLTRKFSVTASSPEEFSGGKRAAQEIIQLMSTKK